jgi:predicted transposase YdaD
MGIGKISNDNREFILEVMKKLELDKKLKEEGKAEGKEEERRQLILKQYRKGLSVEYIADINEFDVEYVKNVVAKG